MNACLIESDSHITVRATSSAAHETGADVVDTHVNLARGAGNQPLSAFCNSLTGVRPFYPYTLFNKSPQQLRLIGARGGRAYGRNQRARRALVPTQPQASPQRAAPGQTTARAVVTLDAQFPWLRGAEKRRSPQQTPIRLKLD